MLSNYIFVRCASAINEFADVRIIFSHNDNSQGVISHHAINFDSDEYFTAAFSRNHPKNSPPIFRLSLYHSMTQSLAPGHWPPLPGAPCPTRCTDALGVRNKV